MTKKGLQRGFVSTQPAETWEEGLICGNGTLGLNAFSRPYDETIIFTHEKMWLPCGNPTPPADMGPRLFEIRRLIDRGLYFQASKLAFDISGQDGFMYPDPFVPAFDFTLKTHGNESMGYSRSVDFTNGEASIQWRDGTNAFSRRLFVSRADGIAVMELTGPEGGLTCSLSLGPRKLGNGIDEKKIARSDGQFLSHVETVKSVATDNLLTYSCGFSKAYPGSVQHLLGMARIVAEGGTSRASGDTLTIANADRILVVVGIELLYDKSHDGTEALTARLEAVTEGYDALLSRHAEAHGELFNRVRLDLGGSDHDTAIEALLDAATTSDLNPALVEKVFDAGRHNIISCTGEWPPALQGIWGGTYVPDWAGDFTHNGNVPSAIAATLMGNTPELMRSYTEYLEFLVPYMEMNARRMFNSRGIVLPSRTSTHGFNNALAPSFAGGFWVAGAAWAAHFFYDYWLYTGDKDFLINHTMPFLEKVAAFFEDYLYDGPDGKYIFSPTQSPENTPLNSNSQGSLNATMDVAAAKEVLINLITVSEQMDMYGDKVPTWKEMLRKMPDYMVTEAGTIKEWLTDRLENNDKHRHSSHLYALYDGIPDEIEHSPKLREAFKATIVDKLDRHWRENATGFMSFGVVQLGQAAASLGEGDLAYECLVHLVNRYWLNNLASMHNHKSLLNMDISGGLPSVIMMMLVASRPGRVTVLPALPSVWKKGAIEGVLCRGQIEVKRLAWEGNTLEATLVSECDQSVSLAVPSNITKAALLDGTTLTSIGNSVELKLVRGQPIGVAITFA